MKLINGRLIGFGVLAVAVIGAIYLVSKVKDSKVPEKEAEKPEEKEKKTVGPAEHSPKWDAVDEASLESFPVSDPPAYHH